MENVHTYDMPGNKKQAKATIINMIVIGGIQEILENSSSNRARGVSQTTRDNVLDEQRMLVGIIIHFVKKQ